MGAHGATALPTGFKFCMGLKGYQHCCVTLCAPCCALRWSLKFSINTPLPLSPVAEEALALAADVLAALPGEAWVLSQRWPG